MRAVTVKLTEADAVSTVRLHVGDRLRIDLPTSPSTGFRWGARTVDASHLQALGRDVRPDSHHLDAAGSQVFVWRAVSPGASQVGLEYRRQSDDRTVAPAKTVAIAVETVAGELEPGSGDPVGSLLRSVASYHGTLPCGDCLHVVVDLVVRAQDGTDWKEAAFVERRRYQGGQGGDRTVAATGKLIVRRGSYADASMTVYVLDTLGGGAENWKLDGDQLLPLDSQMLPLGRPPGQDIALHRVAPGADNAREDASEP